MADIRLASVDQRNSNIARLHRKLNVQIPSPGEKDYRGWEWYYLTASSHQEMMTMNAVGNEQVDWSSDGTKIASIGTGPTARIWNPMDGALIRSWVVGTTWNRGGVWSPDGQRLATGSIRGVLRIWDLANDEPLHTIQIFGGSIYGLSWSPDGKFVASTRNIESKEGGIRVWNASTGMSVFAYGFDRGFDSVGFSHEGTYLIAGGLNGDCNIIDVKTWVQIHQFKAHQGNILDIAANPKEMVFATTGSDGKIHCWSLPGAERISTYFGHEGSVDSVAWDADGRQLVTGGSDGMVKIWSFPGRPNTFKWKPSTDSEITSETSSRGDDPTDSEKTVFRELTEEAREIERLREILGDVNGIPDDEATNRYIALARLGQAPRPTSLRLTDFE